MVPCVVFHATMGPGGQGPLPSLLGSDLQSSLDLKKNSKTRKTVQRVRVGSQSVLTNEPGHQVANLSPGANPDPAVLLSLESSSGCTVAQCRIRLIPLNVHPGKPHLCLGRARGILRHSGARTIAQVLKKKPHHVNSQHHNSQTAHTLPKKWRRTKISAVYAVARLFSRQGRSPAQ